MKTLLVIFSLCFLLSGEHLHAFEPPELMPNPLIEEVIQKSKQLDLPPVQDLKELKKQRFEEIQNQMELLTKRWMEMKRQQSLPVTSQSDENTTPPLEVPAPEEVVVPAQEKPVPALTDLVPQDEAATSQGESMKSAPPIPDILSATVEGDIVNEQGKPEASPKVSNPSAGPIDRFALSSSLFATGHYEECLHVLGAIEQSEWTRYETNWASFLRASCHRKLGQLDVAQQMYRRLVAENDSEWIGTVSAWWLDQIQDQIEIEKQTKAISVALEQWERDVDELTK